MKELKKIFTVAWGIMPEMRTEYNSESLRERDPLEDKGLHGNPD
jgi:hypothetical protein